MQVLLFIDRHTGSSGPQYEALDFGDQHTCLSIPGRTKSWSLEVSTELFVPSCARLGFDTNQHEFIRSTTNKPSRCLENSTSLFVPQPTSTSLLVPRCACKPSRYLQISTSLSVLQCACKPSRCLEINTSLYVPQPTMLQVFVDPYELIHSTM